MAFTLVTSGNGAGGVTGLNTTGAALLVVSIGYSVGGGSAGISDNKSNSWTEVIRRENNDAGVVIYRCFNGTVGSSHNFTPSGSLTAIIVRAYSTSGGTLADDQSFGDTGNSNQPNANSGITAAQALSVTITCCCLNADTIIHSSFGNMTDMNSVQFSSGVNHGLADLHKIQSSAANASGFWESFDAGDWAAVIADFTETPAAGGHPARKRMGGVGFAYGGHQPKSGITGW